MAFISKTLQSTRLRVCGLILIVFAILAAMNALQIGQVLENQALDFWYRLRPSSSPPREIVIVGIDEHSFQDLKKSWPWPRSYHAKITRQLKAAGARLIVFDVLFAEPSNAKDDQAFAEAMREAGNVILATTIESSENAQVARQILVQPYPLFRKAALGMGLTLVTPDNDGIVRRFHCRLGEEETLPETVAHAYLPSLKIPPHLCSLIHFTGPPGHLYTLSYSRVLEGLDPSGGGAHSRQDRPYRSYCGGRADSHSRCLLHALLCRHWPAYVRGGDPRASDTNAAEKKLGGELPLLPRLSLDLVVLLLFGWLLVRVSPFAAMGVLVGFILVIFGLSVYLFLHLNLWLPPVLLCGGLGVVYSGHIFAHYWIESREKRWLRQAFGQYVSESLVESIIAHPERLQLGGEEVEATVLFSDLVGFTSMAENTAPKELIRLLNEYFSTMTEIILAHKGTVDKFIGDAIMAFWGAPLPIADHAALACEAALEMLAAMQLLQKSWESQGFPVISLRIGLHTGPVVAGNVGSKKHFNYTVMGDTVNLAARLEHVNKFYGTAIMMSDATYRRLGNNFLGREVDLVQVHGRAQPVTVYELLSHMPPTGPPSWLPIFEAGRTAYLQGKISEAASRFFEILDLYCDDPPSSVFLKRCQKHLDKPLLSEWKGPHVLENK